VVLPDAKVLNATIDLAGRLEAYYRAPIFARQWLPEKLERRHRREG
jgi:hypothetical protein